MACNTPFRLYKISTFRGGHSVPLVISWPSRIAADQIVRGQYTHVTDLYRRHGAFPFTGILHGVTYVPGPATPVADQQRLDDLRAIGTGLE